MCSPIPLEVEPPKCLGMMAVNQWKMPSPGWMSFLNSSKKWGSIITAGKDVTGLEAKQDTGGGTSDARFMQRICPVFEFGTINKTLHKVNECVSISDLQTTEQIYYKTLENFFQS